MADTAVIINEAGEMGLDHLLVKAVAEQIFELPSGCLCCVRRLDIVTTVRDLIAQRDSGAIGGFSRIVIETSGLADPAPILYTLAVDPMLGHLVTCQAVVTLVDAVAGQETLQRHPEAASQLAVADRILVTKTDLAPLTAELAALLDGLNGWAERIDSPSECAPAALLFAKAPAVANRRRFTAQTVAPSASHTAAIRTLSLVLTEAADAFRFRPRARRAGVGSRQRSAAGERPDRFCRPPGSCRRHPCRPAYDLPPGLAGSLAGCGHALASRLYHTRPGGR